MRNKGKNFFCFFLGFFLFLFQQACNKNDQTLLTKAKSFNQKDGDHDWEIDNGGDNIYRNLEHDLEKFRKALSKDLALLANVTHFKNVSQEEILEASELLADYSVAYSLTQDSLYAKTPRGRVSVNALNNPQKRKVHINVNSWSVGSWCERAELLIHETFGLMGVEDSLDFRKSTSVKGFVAGCIRNISTHDYATLVDETERLTEYFESPPDGLIPYAPLYLYLEKLTNNQFQKWFCEEKVGSDLFGQWIDIHCLEDLPKKLIFAIGQVTKKPKGALLDYSINSKDFSKSMAQVKETRYAMSHSMWKYQQGDSSSMEEIFPSVEADNNVYFLSFHSTEGTVLGVEAFSTPILSLGETSLYEEQEKSVWDVLHESHDDKILHYLLIGL